GIFSSVAQSHGGYTGLGIAEARDVLRLSGFQTALYRGQTVDATAVIIKYTYTGDANLDGKIDGDDYFRIDSGKPRPPAYAAGDFNYDGVINADDHFWIDSNYWRQGGVVL